MHELSTLDRNALLGAKNSQKFQECQGVADACSFCFDLVATHKLSGEILRRRIADHLLAAWPADYRAYRKRCGVSTRREATLRPSRGCLDLRAWYATVDALYREVACAEAAASAQRRPGEDRSPTPLHRRRRHALRGIKLQKELKC